MAAPPVARPSTRGSSVTRVLPFGSRRGFTPSVIEGDLGRVRQIAADDDSGNGRPVAVPVMGRIAAYCEFFFGKIAGVPATLDEFRQLHVAGGAAA